jgi:hypothetical protein
MEAVRSRCPSTSRKNGSSASGFHEAVVPRRCSTLITFVALGSKAGLPPWGPHVRSAKGRHWSGRVVRWSSCAILLSLASSHHRAAHQGRREGRTARHKRKATGHRAGRASAQGGHAARNPFSFCNTIPSRTDIISRAYQVRKVPERPSSVWLNVSPTTTYAGE